MFVLEHLKQVSEEAGRHDTVKWYAKADDAFLLAVKWLEFNKRIAFAYGFITGVCVALVVRVLLG